MGNKPTGMARAIVELSANHRRDITLHARVRAERRRLPSDALLPIAD
jgi:hypothetical protein